MSSNDLDIMAMSMLSRTMTLHQLQAPKIQQPTYWVKMCSNSSNSTIVASPRPNSDQNTVRTVLSGLEQRYVQFTNIQHIMFIFTFVNWFSDLYIYNFLAFLKKKCIRKFNDLTRLQVFLHSKRFLRPDCNVVIDELYFFPNLFWVVPVKIV